MQRDDAPIFPTDHYRVLIDTIPHIVWMARGDGYTWYLNPWVRHLGIPEDAVLGWRWLDLIHPDDRFQAGAAWQTAVASTVSYRNQYRLRLGNGSYCHYLSQAVPLLDKDGAVATWIGTWTDIDELERAKEELTRETNALLLRDRAIQALTPGVLISDPNLPDNPIIYVSPGFERLTLYSAAEVLGKNCRFLQGKDTDPAAVDKIRKALATRQPCTVELLNYRRDGESFWNELSLAPVRDSQGELSHFVGVQTDITQRRRLEEQFRQAQKMEAIGQLAGGVAHDFNNLLTVINGYAELVLDSLPAGDPLREPIGQIFRAGECSAALTRQLLAFSRQQVLSPRMLQLNDVIDDFQRLLLRLIGEDIELTTRLAPDLGRIFADSGQIEQILMNLTVNARDAMPGGGKVTIETSNVEAVPATARRPGQTPAPMVLLRFSDTGCGIPTELRARIFEPFFTTKEQGRGTGLGLSVVHGIVIQSGGAIEVASLPDQGTTFEIYLPRADLELPPEPAARPNRPPTGHETILLVEDNGLLRGLLAQVLRSNGYKVHEASSGEVALDIARTCNETIHLMLTDVVMPGLGGRLLAEQIRPLHPETRVIFLSGYTSDEVIRRGIQKAEVYFLQKPFSAQVLNQKVREVLAR